MSQLKCHRNTNTYQNMLLQRMSYDWNKDRIGTDTVHPQTKICGAGLLSLDSDVENRKTFHLLKEKHHHFLRYKAPSTAVLPRRSPAGKPEMSGDHKWDVLPSGKWMQMSLFRLVTGWKLWSNPEGLLEFASKWQQFSKFSKQSAASSATDLKLLLFCRAYDCSWACSRNLMGLSRALLQDLCLVYKEISEELGDGDGLGILLMDKILPSPWYAKYAMNCSVSAIPTG